MSYKSVVASLLKQANVEIDGTRAQDIQVRDDRFYQRFLREGRLGLGESYMDGWWDCERIDEFMLHLFNSKLKMQRQTKTWRFALTLLKSKLMPGGSRKRSHEVAHKHYNLGNELFECTLDKHMIYTCPIWTGSNTLEEAQEAKLDLVCRKLQLKPGMRVLDVGSGWGGFGKYAAQKYGVEVVGVSISKEQNEWATRSCSGLPVKIELIDYREVGNGKLGTFDRIVCLEMIEHVGLEYYRTYFETMNSVLKDDGLFLIQANVLNDSNYFNPWLIKYIFPGGYVPSVSQVSRPFEGIFFIEHMQNIGPHYYRTFLKWNENFESNWHKIKHLYDERFFRMWRYYLLSCAPGYIARYIQVYQMVLSKRGRTEAYSF